MKNKLLLLFFTMLVGSCKSPTSYYEIPIIDKILIINTPTFNDYAYISIYTKKSYIIKDVADFKIIRGATTDISLIFNIQKNDTIYYSDRWNDVTLLSKKNIYKKIKWYDDRFYIKEASTNIYHIKHNYIEIVIKDYANFIVYQLDNSYQILKPKYEIE
ncbi:hypothetical protein NNC51_13980 [Prevotella copri]|jgi:hypothetical protein|uniref:Lipoprotein n=1 Tax=Segatella copri TaxID=165179 RepID=A0AAW5IZS2_9BACT|nr:hypothetical protein [Segatella copri]MCP9553890.1 hypothetical protein [Segatella copri]MCP9574693.1 hypothetical protein [Segatella copri]MCP9577601.1 hypothetical protein [Segatella copri]MCP9580506.1 hypothetical protein [Segatella copri]MCP9583423.1 hypothetical protein [Segatella copri]